MSNKFSEEDFNIIKNTQCRDTYFTQLKKFVKVAPFDGCNVQESVDMIDAYTPNERERLFHTGKFLMGNVSYEEFLDVNEIT